MTMSDKHKVSINPQRNKTFVSLWEQYSAAESGQANFMKRNGLTKADKPPVESTKQLYKQLSLFATSRREIMDTMTTTVVDTVQNSSRNHITMKNYLGKEVSVSLEFGSMRNGLSSTDEDSEEENESETVYSKMKKLNLG